MSVDAARQTDRSWLIVSTLASFSFRFRKRRPNLNCESFWKSQKSHCFCSFSPFKLIYWVFIEVQGFAVFVGSFSSYHPFFPHCIEFSTCLGDTTQPVQSLKKSECRLTSWADSSPPPPLDLPPSGGGSSTTFSSLASWLDPPWCLRNSLVLCVRVCIQALRKTCLLHFQPSQITQPEKKKLQKISPSTLTSIWDMRTWLPSGMLRWRCDFFLKNMWNHVFGYGKHWTPRGGQFPPI